MDDEFERAVGLHREGRLTEAQTVCEQILSGDPAHPRALHLLGAIRFATGESEAAVALLQRAVSAKPDYAEAHYNLGAMFAATGDLTAAVRHFGTASSLRQDHFEAHVRHGGLLLQLGRFAEAETAFRNALALRPDHALVLIDLSSALFNQGNAEAAAEAARRAVTLAPDIPEAHLRVGQALQRQGRKAEAMVEFLRATELDPNAAYAWSRLGLMHMDSGDPTKATAAFRRAVTLQPQDAPLHSGLISIQPLDPATTASDMVAQRRAWAERFADPLTRTAPTPTNSRDPHRRLRVGYVACLTCRYHTNSMVLLPLVEAHDKNAVEVYCYSDTPPEEEDDVTARFRRSTIFRETHKLDDAEYAAQLRNDGIDIAIDLVGHPIGSRLLALARKPAPIQICFPTMGSFWMTAIDYTISDNVITPRAMLSEFRERVLRLPVGYLYMPLDDVPCVESAMAYERIGRVTFGCFGRISKINDRVLAAWAEILRRVPGSTLLLKPGLGDKGFIPAFRRRMDSHGLDAERVVFVEWIETQEDYLAAYSDIDIVLDTFPYGGVTTTCESLLMGIPVVTLATDRVLGRYSAAFLAKLGLDRLIAHSVDDYVAIAAELARDRASLRSVRQGLSERFRSSRFCDAKRMTRDLERAFRAMWRKWCREQP